jgi:hypothetical protein
MAWTSDDQTALDALIALRLEMIQRGGVKSYTLNGSSYTFFNLDAIDQMIDKLRDQKNSAEVGDFGLGRVRSAI